MRGLAVASLAALGVVSPGGCGGGASDAATQPNGSAAAERVPQTTPLRIMSFNIEWGGAHVRFAAIADAIRAADADIVGVQEAEGNLARLADDLGWHYSRRNHVIPKYPPIDPPGADGKYLLVEVRPGKVVAIASVHLPSSPSGAAWIRAGRTEAEILAMEGEVRLPIIVPFLDPLPGFAQRGLPVFLTGDFNAPSHEDWTEAAIGKFPHRTRTMAWPVTRAVGLRDSFRDIHRNPVENPGFTWWAARPIIPDYNPTDPTRQTRIDFVWYGGPATVTGSRLVGEAGAPDVAVSVAPWPSDHRAVVSDFDTVPAAMPVLVATEHRVHQNGKPLQVVYRNATPRGSLVLERHGTEPVTERRIALTEEQGRLELPDTFLAPGAYQLSLRDTAGVETSRNDFRIVAPDAKPVIEVGGERFSSDEPLPVAWQNAPGNRYDWVGVYQAAVSGEQNYSAWSYIGARSAGTMQLAAENAAQAWPLRPGRYVARLLLDDGYALLAKSAPFAVD
jgi:endonuclease/exonuclease/phosphatase family metal-dependent hydrolase